jgi:hypothetical protein
LIDLASLRDKVFTVAKQFKDIRFVLVNETDNYDLIRVRFIYRDIFVKFSIDSSFLLSFLECLFGGLGE